MNRDEILVRLSEIQKLKRTLETGIQYSGLNNENIKENFDEGISVIIPSYKGEQVISTCLESLQNQTLDRRLFEVIIVINGEKDRTENIIKEFIRKTGMNNIFVYSLDIASASVARNEGIQKARMKYTVFLDDDDYISPNYLEEMLNYSNDRSVVVSQIVNVDLNGRFDEKNPINSQIKMAYENNKELEVLSVSMVSTINACKSIPTRCVKQVYFDPSLKSGEDVVFFVELFTRFQLYINIIPIEKKAIYYRQLRENSVSRQDLSFDFNVTQRLEVIRRLNDILAEATSDRLIVEKIKAQSSFIRKYLEVYQDEKNRQRVVNEILKYKLSYFPFHIINKGKAKKLVVSYCFPPYMDTSGNVMAKRIRQMNEVVDVVFNKMDRVRETNLKLNYMVDDLIENKYEIPSYTSFSNWKAIKQFCDLGFSYIMNKKYEEVYSRALWPGSHFLACLYKLHNKQVKWVAEFSDPIIFDVHGKVRKSEIENDEYFRRINKEIKKRYKISRDDNNNLFFWCEYLAYLFADEIIFTNKNQMKYMIDQFPISDLKEQIKHKSRIVPHPTLPAEYYHIEKSDYDLDPSKIHIGYFGSFYETRNLNEILYALKSLDEDSRRRFVLHVFTGDPKSFKEQILKDIEDDYLIRVNPYVGYYEFLNLTTKFDCLLVNDASTKEYMSVNPYLPSKLSDYLGSGRKIWGIYEEGSILSEIELHYKSELGDQKGAEKILKEILSTHSRRRN